MQNIDCNVDENGVGHVEISFDEGMGGRSFYDDVVMWTRDRWIHDTGCQTGPGLKPAERSGDGA